MKKSKPVIDASIEPEKIAEVAGLEYVSDKKPGIKRELHGKKYTYIGTDGKVIKDTDEIIRIKSLAIPPAYNNVWICPKKNGHLQATGFDSRGRKQYRYHKRWREVSDETKFNKMIEFAKALPAIRKQVKKDLALSGMPKEKVVAAIVYLLEITLIRVGNEEYAKENESFGLTTLRNRHVDVEGSKITFRFRGKSGKNQAIRLNDRRLAKIVKRCKDLPGQDLFEYIDDNEQVVSVNSTDVNDYLQKITQEHFTAKDFRTWAGTVLAIFALQDYLQFESETEAKRNIVQAIEKVAYLMENTPAVCRKAYIHPDILNAYNEKKLLNLKNIEEKVSKVEEFTPDEVAILSFLEKRLIKT